MNRAEALEIRRSLLSAGIKMTDGEALKAKICFESWKTNVDYEIDERVVWLGELYKVRQAHTSQEGWEPDKVPAMFELIEPVHSGEESDPIPWRNGLACEANKYYTESGKLYKALRDSGNPLYYSISDLIGTYFEEITNNNVESE